jgi:hypothetical protein
VSPWTKKLKLQLKDLHLQEARRYSTAASWRFAPVVVSMLERDQLNIHKILSLLCPALPRLCPAQALFLIASGF